MVRDFFIGIAGTLPLAVIAVANPEHVADISNNPLTINAINNINQIFGVDLTAHAKTLSTAVILAFATFTVTLISYVLFGRRTAQRKALNKNIKLVFDSIENGRQQLALLEATLRQMKYGNIHIRAFEKIGHARRILDALEHRARHLARYYLAITTSNFDEVEALFEKPLKFSVSCINSVRDTQSIEVIPEIVPLEAIYKLDLLFNGVRKEIESYEENSAKKPEQALEEIKEKLLQSIAA